MVPAHPLKTLFVMSECQWQDSRQLKHRVYDTLCFVVNDNSLLPKKHRDDVSGERMVLASERSRSARNLENLHFL
jgi:hypothetical protein